MRFNRFNKLVNIQTYSFLKHGISEVVFLIKNYKIVIQLDCDDIGATPKISFVKLTRFG